MTHRLSGLLWYPFLLSLTYFLYFYISKQRKYCFWYQIFKMEILMDLHVLRSTESENHIFSVWSVCICVCVCVSMCRRVCYQHNSKTNQSRNINFGILLLYHIRMLLETFRKDRTKFLCTGAHKRILKHEGLWTKFRVTEFSYIQTAVNIMKFTYMFAMARNM